MVNQGSMLVWKEGGGDSVPWVYEHSSLCEIYFGVMVLQRSMLNWRRGMESVCHGYICILPNMKLIWCSGFPEIYA